MKLYVLLLLCFGMAVSSISLVTAADKNAIVQEILKKYPNNDSMQIQVAKTLNVEGELRAYKAGLSLATGQGTVSFPTNTIQWGK